MTARVGFGSAASVWAVKDSGGNVCTSGNDYCAWGTDSEGLDFCCELAVGPNPNPFSISIVTSSQSDENDVVRLTYFNGTSTYNLSAIATIAVDASVDTGSGDDTIVGSKSTDANYSEVLFGNDGNDDITGNAGIDFIEGGGGVDTCSGGGGDDTIEGGDGDDALSGDDGDDTISGDDGDDGISGGDGDDVLDGGLSNDDICGDGNTLVGDQLIGGPDGDNLWGNQAADFGNGGGGSDFCDSSGTYLSCTATLSSRPSLCP